MGSTLYEISAPRQGNEPMPLYVSVSKYDASWHSIMHSHTNTELFYCVSGEGRFRVRDEDISVHADDLIVINPNVEHTEYSLANKQLEYIVLGVEGIEFTAPDGNGMRYRSLNYKENREELLPYFTDITNEISAKRENYVEVCKIILQILFLKMNRHTSFDLVCSPVKQTKQSCIQAKRYIDEHFREAIDLNGIAERAHISKYYLAHSFRKEYALSPMYYLTRQRIRESEHLLSVTDYPLGIISDMVGFSSPSYFSQCFKKIAGISPAEYRKTHKHASEKEADGGAAQ